MVASIRLVLLIDLLLTLGQPAWAQPIPSITPPGESGINKGRFIGVAVGTAAFYTVTLLLLRKQWYKKKMPFHMFNDNREWLQMDKVGHMATAYCMSRGGYELMRWSGVDERASILTGGLLALLFQTTLEVYDGHADGWGFSKGDMVANVAGTALFMGQQIGTGQQAVSLKYGFRKTIYPPFRPNLLGKTVGQQMLKDYNGQQYWLSVNLASVLPVGSDFPRWLNMDIGYSGSGMTGGHENPPMTDKAGNSIEFKRYRQFFISPDVDLSRINQPNPLHPLPWQRLVGTVQFFKIAAPSLEFNPEKGLRFHPLLLPND
ncbi:DUF2279 domain-containing protein [Fibrivirga algicola]|uniref:DUF2279 domain-containing protein n=1 Tax=Fibrivirga algicola TaxID=2950420 RepID=A0ABX0QKS9_9BACT|nr:DUF2279 domain-containing protein [Fibrivirga algicola]ARK10035.1 hypothetical protein A6C57_06605 [Fibrella sp. ES10-3-2-2]NID11507.1 DUF2279 domain-containing protein [Fibrivirga algicola]